MLITNSTYIYIYPLLLNTTLLYTNRDVEKPPSVDHPHFPAITTTSHDGAPLSLRRRPLSLRGRPLLARPKAPATARNLPPAVDGTRNEGGRLNDGRDIWYVCVYKYIYMYIYIHVCMYTCRYVYVYASIYMDMFIIFYNCVCVSVCACVCVQPTMHMHVCIYKYMCNHL